MAKVDLIEILSQVICRCDKKECQLNSVTTYAKRDKRVNLKCEGWPEFLFDFYGDCSHPFVVIYNNKIRPIVPSSDVIFVIDKSGNIYHDTNKQLVTKLNDPNCNKQLAKLIVNQYSDKLKHVREVIAAIDSISQKLKLE